MPTMLLPPIKPIKNAPTPTINIRINPKGRIEVAGNLPTDPLTAHEMLHAANVVIHQVAAERAAKAAASKIITATPETVKEIEALKASRQQNRFKQKGK